MDYEVKADALEESFDALEMKPERPVLVAEQPASGGRAVVVGHFGPSHLPV